MQLLFQRSFEHGETEGLSIFKGNVKKYQITMIIKLKLKYQILVGVH